MRLARVKDIPYLYDGVYTEGAIRWLIANSKKYKFDKCVMRPTKGKILIDLDAFEAWIKKHKKE